MRAVLDSNVLISARLEPRGPSAQLLEAWADDEFYLIASPQLLEELRGVLGRERLRRWLTEGEADLFVQSLRDNATIIDDPSLERGITRDPDDDFVVALARVAEADYVVSGDRHLLELVDQRPPVLTPRALLDLLIRERGKINPA